MLWQAVGGSRQAAWIDGTGNFDSITASEQPIPGPAASRLFVPIWHGPDGRISKLSAMGAVRVAQAVSVAVVES
jgi:hypothetical protein